MIIFFLILALVVVRPYFNPSFPYTHDGENHLARFANYKLALKEGQFPPRFAPNLLNHYGYPVFNYNYPLANILSVPFSAVKLNYELTFKILVLAFVVLGLVGANLWLKQLGFATKNRVLALLALGFSPYLSNLIYFRGNIGELMALMIFPWLTYLIEAAKPQSLVKKFWPLIGQTLLWTMFFLSHNIMVLFGTPLLIAYALIKYQRRLVEQKRLIFGFGSGLLLSLWFWLPALVEKNLVILENATLSKGYLDHFPTFEQLLFAPLRFGFSVPGSVDTLSFQVGLIFVISLILASLSFWRIQSQTIRLLVLLGWGLFVLQLAFTKPVWSVVPLSNFIQFPWRLSFFLILVTLPVIAWVAENLGRKTKILLLILLVWQILNVVRLRPADYFHRDIITYDVFPASTSTANENLPQNFRFEYFAGEDWQPTARLLTGEGSVDVNWWRGSHRAYLLNLETDAILVEPTAYFAGWQTWANNEVVTYIDSATIGGRLAYELPAGHYQIQTRFTQNTPSRQIGNGLSLITLIGLTGLGIYSTINHAKQKRV